MRLPRIEGEPQQAWFGHKENPLDPKVLKVLDRQLTFEVDDQGRATAVIMHQNGGTQRVPRID